MLKNSKPSDNKNERNLSNTINLAQNQDALLANKRCIQTKTQKQPKKLQKKN